MKWTVEHVDAALASNEDENREFKAARRNFHLGRLLKYCAAIANEGGGSVILGVTDKRPRKVVGTDAFCQPERTRSVLIDKLHLNVTFSDVQHPDGRVLVFDVPPCPTGMAIQADGVYWQRQGDGLQPMSEDRLRQVFAESGHDFSSDICTGLAMEDLDTFAIEDFRKRWIAKSRNRALATLGHEQLLSDAGAMVDGQLT